MMGAIREVKVHPTKVFLVLTARDHKLKPIPQVPFSGNVQLEVAVICV